jgi:hypothetical protein
LPPERVNVDPNLKEPLEKLAQALHRAIEQSEDVDRALAAIREEGVQAWLLLEVTVALGSPPAGGGEAERQMGFADAASGEASDDWLVEIDSPLEPTSDADGPLAPRVAPDDRDFLRSIRIRLD